MNEFYQTRSGLIFYVTRITEKCWRLKQGNELIGYFKDRDAALKKMSKIKLLNSKK